jgi:ribosome-interacting GTPase 1
MLPYEDIQFQLVEAPPIVAGSSDGKANGFQVLSVARNADCLIIMVDLTDEPVKNFLIVVKELENSKIMTMEPEGKVEITKRGHGSNIQFLLDGQLVGCTPEEIVALLKEYKIRSALVRIMGEVSIDIVEDAIFGNAVFRPTLILANKSDQDYDKSLLEKLRETAAPLEILSVSTNKTPQFAEIVGLKLFNLLGIIRVYTKQPGKEVVEKPIVVRKGTTVGELAKIIHSDFYNRFKYARVWGSSVRFNSIKVGIDQELLDGDIVQFYV